nr:MAG TPA: hypothetical protein [Caudoviricetes sp.]
MSVNISLSTSKRCSLVKRSGTFSCVIFRNHFSRTYLL